MLNNQKGFTLIEMLFVLMIISVLLILIIPSFSSKSSGVHDKGCDALVKVVQAQADIYQLNESKTASSIKDLIDAEYISEDQKSCQNEKVLKIDLNGIVSATGSGD